ncbi:hypothetical protein GM418_29330 [Maribellus comscasis]|uniref:STAS/SEC14 domain-containing protein n=1 Tax=Maribellus comscasis TaxID=2681766 RepID=A0A6I6K7J6_9BACT|nr:hypothetical protein [Maribellus comscasis]QGY47623.1 hypothetical protein GM418_29330 [Maribellus comscasis]
MNLNSHHILITERLKLVIVTHKNVLTQESIQLFVQEVLQNPFFKPDYNVLIDIRNSVINMSIGEIEECSNHLFQQLNKIKLKKLAILTKTASQAIKAVEFVHFYKQSSLFQVFSSIEATLSWLEIPIIRKSQIKLKLYYLSNC